VRASKIRLFVYDCVSVSARWRPGAGLRRLSRHWRQRQLLRGALKLFEKCSCVEGHASPASTLAACCPRSPTSTSPASAHPQKTPATSHSLRSPPQHSGRGCPHACERPPSHTRTRSHRAGHSTTGTHRTCIWHLHHWVHRLEDRSSLRTRSVRPSLLISPRRTRESGKKICCVETPAPPPTLEAAVMPGAAAPSSWRSMSAALIMGFGGMFGIGLPCAPATAPPSRSLERRLPHEQKTRRCRVRALRGSLH
jgi:hypothetical protein